MKKVIATLTTLIIILLTYSLKVSAAQAPPEFTEDGVVLMDGTTGDILYSKNMDTPYPPASTTKTMTILLTLEKCKLTDVVTVGKNPPLIAARTSNVSLVEGEQVTVKDLLYGLILQSGNDCAETLAEYIGGTSQNFAKMMNARAKELKCTNTNFVNPSGLYDVNHKTSAKDLALIMREVSKHPTFKEISTTPYYVIPPNNKYPNGHPMSNENKIVSNKSYNIPGYEGSKTGYTTESLFSFTAVASRNGQKLVVAFVHGKQATYYSDAKTLLDYGFDNFDLIKLYNKETKVLDYKVNSKLTVPLLASEDYYYVREKGSKDEPVIKYNKVALSNKSFKVGDPLLTATFTLGTKQLTPLKLNSSINHSTAKDVSPKKGHKTLIICLISIPALVVLLAFLTRKINLRKKRVKKYENYFYKQQKKQW